jgi:hypothetical protein
MKKTITRTLATCIAVLALTCTPAWASSAFLYGTNLKVEPDKDGGVTVQVLVLIDNYKRGPELAVRTRTPHPRCCQEARRGSIRRRTRVVWIPAPPAPLSTRASCSCW